MSPSVVRILRSLVVLLVGPGVAACASSGGAMAPDRPAVTNIGFQASDTDPARIHLWTVEDIDVRSDTLVAAEGDVYRYVVAAYNELGIPLNEVRPDNRLIGAESARVRGALKGTRLSTYLRCGTNITGDVADQYDVYITALSQVQPLQQGAAVHTYVQGFAVQGATSTNRIRCASSGRLEREILEHLQRRAASES